MSVFDERSYRLLHSVHVAGEPVGLLLVDTGKKLLVTDAISGTISMLQVAPKIGDRSEIMTIGPATIPMALLAPQALPAGHRLLCRPAELRPLLRLSRRRRLLVRGPGSDHRRHLGLGLLRLPQVRQPALVPLPPLPGRRRRLPHGRTELHEYQHTVTLFVNNGTA